MPKKTVILIILLFTSSSLAAQSIFLDALTLKENIQNNELTLDVETLGILSHYFPELGPAERDSVELEGSIIGQYLSDNPFLHDLQIIGRTRTSRFELAQDYTERGFLSTIGSIDVTNAALGVSDFLIERTKQELNVYFFRRLKDELNSDKYKLLATLLPNSKQILELIGNEIYHYDLYLQSLRSAFEKDLRQLPQNTSSVLDDLRSSDILTDHQYHALQLSLEITQWIRDSRHPGEILNLTSESRHLNSLANSGHYLWNDFSNGIKTMNLFSQSFRDVDNSSQYWVGRNRISTLRDGTTLKVYLGLLYEVSKQSPYDTIEFRTGEIATEQDTLLPAGSHPLHEFLRITGEEWEQQSTNRQAIQDFLLEISSQIDKIETITRRYRQNIEELRSDEGLSRRERNRMIFDMSMELYTSFTELVEHAFTVDELPYLKGQFTISEEIRNATKQMLNLGSVAIHIDSRQYAGAVTSVGLLLNDIVSSEDQKEAVSRFLKYGSFMASFVEAQSPAEAKAAIETIALPPGSYSIKRRSAFNISLNAYLGMFLGNESDSNFRFNNFFPGYNNIAISAPVGLSFSHGFGQQKLISSIGLFIPMIDLGTVTSYRWNMETEDSFPSSIQLRHLFAPGAIVEFGIYDTPLVLGIGWQMGPQLREVATDSDMENLTSNNYHRYGITVRVDIPLLNLHTRTYKKLRD